jgi:hypothetical protein
MPQDTVRSFKVGEEVYDVPPDRQEKFLSVYPDAQEIHSFKVGEEVYDVPTDRLQAFTEHFGDQATPLSEYTPYEPVFKQDFGS